MAFTSKPSTIPEFATTDIVDPTTGENNVIEPSAGKKASGWNYLEKPARNYFNWIHRFNYLWINYFNQFFSSTHQLKIDEIIENTGSAGVSITGLKADIISEKTGAAGVTIDGVLLKDNAVFADTISEKTTAAGVTFNQRIKPLAGIKPTGYLHNTGITQNSVFDALSSSIPNINDTIKINGSGGGVAPFGTPFLMYLFTYALRYDANTIRLYCYKFISTSAGSLMYLDAVDGSSTVFIIVYSGDANLSIAW